LLPLSFGKPAFATILSEDREFSATAIAIPAGFVAMAWWLRGFVYHVDLPAWTFQLAATAAVVIAWLTVSWQSFAVARAKPAGALRCE
jgi:putative ABC transport system permease protein